MFTQFGATADTISKASTMVFRIGTDAHLYDDPDDINIIPLLDSKYDSEKCEALKRLLALIAQGFDVSNFFPQVVKNVASQSLEVKKLVYLYLLHYAEKRPNEALLSINCFQKDLGDTNPLVRAWALRTMAGIRLHATSPLVLLAVSKCARDPSVYVRRCAANALPKLHDLRQEENASAIEEIVGILLNDNSPGIVGAAAAAFNSVCPNNLSLIGKNYTRLCETLPDVDDWGQIILIGILLRYLIARHGLVKESIMFLDAGHADKEDMRDDTSEVVNSDVAGGIFLPQVAKVIARSYIEGPGNYISRSSNTNEVYSALDDASVTSAESNDDVKILLKCTSPLLWSHNSAVVLAAAGVHWIVAPKDDVIRIAKPLLFVLRSSTTSKYVVLCNIQVFAKAMPSLFAAYYEDFFISTSDSYQIKALKLEILSSIATDSSIPYIFQEFQDYIRDPDRRFAVDTIAALGVCAQRLKKVVNVCLEGLLCLTSQEYVTGNIDSVDGEAGILIQAVMSIKEIVKQDPSGYEKVILQLIRRLDLIKIPAARAIIIWMLGEYNSTGQIIPKTLTTVLKYLAYCFTSEASETKLQILNTAVKIFLYAEGEDVHTYEKVVCYMLELAKFDFNYDIRDRARLLKKLIESSLGCQNEDKNCAHVNKESAHVIAGKVFGKKNDPLCPEPIDYRIYLPGSLSQIVLHAAPGYEPLPNPCSLDLTDSSQASDGTQISEDSYGSDDSASFSGSVDERSACGYSSRHSTGSHYNEGSDGSVSAGDENAGQFIQLSDAENTSDRQTGSTEARITQSDVSGMEEIISKKALESWLGEQPLSSDLISSEQDHVQKSARISIGNISSRVKPKSYTLLDSASGNGLKVDYSFSSQISDIPTLLVCVEVSFQNCSAEPLSEVILADEEAGSGPESRELLTVAMERTSGSHSTVPTLVPMDEIDILNPGQIVKRTIQVHFNHHLLPLKLTLWCNGKKHPVKLRPDIGYFVKPLPMNINTYRSREAQLPGMFEYVRRCSFTDHILQMNSNEGGNSITKDVYLVICESLALKMLSNANLFLVSVDMPVAAKLDDASGLCLRFSCEILSSSMPCLITVAIEGKCMEPLGVSVKVNCEETVFGLNLLNRVVNFLVEPSFAA